MSLTFRERLDAIAWGDFRTAYGPAVNVPGELRRLAGPDRKAESIMNANWFAAHVILWVKYTEHEQKTFPLWENVILIKAQSAEEALAKAEMRGQRMAGKDKPTFTWGGKPATWVFGGVRKVTACDDAEQRPDDGTEITYTQMRVRSAAALKKLLAGEPVGVQYIEQYRGD